MLRLLGNKGTFRRNALIVSSGSLANILIALLLTPIITRLYSKSEFGIFYLFLSFVVNLRIIINGMYPHALIVPKFKRDFLALFKLSIYLTFFGSLVVGVLILISKDYILAIFQAEAIGNYLYLLPLALLIASSNDILLNWNARNKVFSRNALANITGGATEKSIQLGFGFFLAPIFPFLIISRMISDLVRSLALSTKKIFIDLKTLSVIKIKELRRIAQDFKKYPFLLLPGNFFNNFSGDLPLYLLSANFGLGAVGAFGFANNILNIPFDILGKSIAPVYYQKAAELYHDNLDRLKEFTLKTYEQMLILSCIAFGGIFALGPIFFYFVFGSEWKLAGEIASILSIYYVFKLISSPFTKVFLVIRREEIALYTNIAIALFRSLGIIIGVMYQNLIVAISIYMLGNVVAYILTNISVFYALKIDYLKVGLQTIFTVGIIFSIFYFIKIFLEHLIPLG